MVIRRIGVLVALTLAMSTPAARAQFNPPGGMGRGGGGFGRDHRRFEETRARSEALGALNLESMWAILCFGVELAPAQVDSLRGSFRAAWHQRASLLEGSDKFDEASWDAVRGEFKDLRKELDRRIESLLTEDQRREFSRQLKAAAKMAPRLPEGASGPPERGR